MYYLRWIGEDGREKYQSLGHSEKRQAELQRREKELELVRDIEQPQTMKLSELLEDYVRRTRTQIERSTANLGAYCMKHLIAAVGDITAESVTYKHCELLQQYCFDNGLGPASVNMHSKLIKRIFELAVKRGQLLKNPFDGVRLVKVPKKLIRLFSEKEFNKLLAAATSLIWKARILLDKTTGLRRGEVLNLTVNDVDFLKGKVLVQPKEDTEHTWRWVIKDKDRRELPLVDEVAQLLREIQGMLPKDQTYLLLSPQRYQHLMMLKAKGKLTYEMRKCPDGNFCRNWKVILKRARIKNAVFRDLRSTCITEWFEKGLVPHEVQKLAGHADINTTMKYYVGIRESLIDRARDASRAALGENFSAHFVRACRKGKESIPCKATQPLANDRLTEKQDSAA